ncbi:efflux RND transporter periplasmic adaptor subunit [uncultured Thiodictyon sp.]|uniref:efflux RND transporter periplasmic adaptor subunit n=1 Tax=uncultured Thiodictyon sp. TaxID=1846217 RepID=UPI0025FDC9B0|nr:efflux RND transporter periplasmic adaptor subunit [uncultured Thiodictyon sp.]
MRSTFLRGIALLIGIALVGGCDKPAGSSPAAGPGAAKPPPPEVSVLVAHAQSVPLTRELVGRLAATRSAQVRARVAGVLLERVYTEGTDVTPGQVLFRIDPARLQAQVNEREAALVRAEADATNAALIAKRYVELREKKTMSQQDLDTAQATERTTAAAVKQARANLDAVRLELGYATVTAPIAGRAGRALVTEGTLVGQGEATLLTTVDRIDPIYVNFSRSLAELADLRKAAAPGSKGGAGTQVELLLPDGTPYAHRGTLDFSDLAVDPNTGALSLRATMPNPDKLLLPGMFVTLRLTVGQVEQAFLLPQPALARDAQGAYLLVVDDTGKVIQRRVDTRGMTRKEWILTGDLKDGEQVIVAGLQKVKPGDVARIAVTPAAPATAADKPKAEAPPTAAQGSK